jgi:L-aspartate oxidase
VHSGDDASGAEVHRALLAALIASGIEILDRTVALDLIVENPAAGDAADGGRAGTGAGRPTVGGAAAANAHPDGAPARVPVPARGVAGLTAGVIGPDGRLSAGVIEAPAVVIATGGLGQAFATTSNPAGATGDGIAIAARAGAVLRDLEFVQFHPTVLWRPGASGQCPLITEALRGAGAVLRDLDGTPLMAGHDPRGDLAPRDVVAARMAEVIAAGTAGHVWLDATGLDPELLEKGFPTVTAACRKHSIDPVTEYIPVAPGAHYSCGGILADLDGRTSVPGLYAVGEAASTGVQGANRLASNSVTEAIIAGRRAGQALAVDGPGTGPGRQPSARSATPATPIGAVDGVGGRQGAGRGGKGPLGDGVGDRNGAERGGRRALAVAMSRWAGVSRDREGLSELVRLISGWSGAGAGERAVGGTDPERVGGAVRHAGAETGAAEELAGSVRDEDLGVDLDLESVEAANLRVVSGLIAAGALRRAESRGCHRRRDAAWTAERPWHTALRWDGKELVVAEEEL